MSLVGDLASGQQCNRREPRHQRSSHDGSPVGGSSRRNAWKRRLLRCQRRGRRPRCRQPRVLDQRMRCQATVALGAERAALHESDARGSIDHADAVALALLREDPAVAVQPELPALLILRAALRGRGVGRDSAVTLSTWNGRAGGENQDGGKLPAGHDLLIVATVHRGESPLAVIRAYRRPNQSRRVGMSEPGRLRIATGSTAAAPTQPCTRARRLPSTTAPTARQRCRSIRPSAQQGHNSRGPFPRSCRCT